MPAKKHDRPLYQRILLDVAGFGLIFISPFTGLLPGPGGIPVFLLGLGLVALSHEWAANLLQDFEKKREQFTDKVLMASPRISHSIDVLCLAALLLASWILVTQSHFVVRGLAIGTISVSVLVIFSNQKRFERIANKLKNHRK